MLCIFVPSSDVNLHLPRMRVLFSGELHFVHVSAGPYFLLLMCTWTPHDTSREYQRVR